MDTPETPLTAFVSYSRRDARFRERLEIQIASLRQQGRLDLWNDLMFVAGDAWEPILLEKLKTADLILLLVSPYFLASDFIHRVELKTALERHAQGTARVIPILLRPVDLKESPLAAIQWLPRNGKSISLWRNKDEAWLDVQRELQQVITVLQERRKTATASGASTDSAFVDGTSQASSSTAGAAATQDERLERQMLALYDALQNLNLSMLDEVVFRSRLPVQHLSMQATPSIRARELLELARTQGPEGIRALTSALLRVVPGSVPQYL